MKRVSNPEKETIDISKFRKNKRVAKNTNQFLRDGNYKLKTLNLTEENPFDIEKIIADLHLQKEKRVAVVAKAL